MLYKKIIFSFVFILGFISCSEDPLTIDSKGNVTGKVVELGVNTPIENVKIQTTPVTSTVFTDVNGDFSISNIQSGSYSLQASKEGYLTSFEGIQVVADGTINSIFELSDDSAGNTAPTQPILLSPTDSSVNENIVVDLNWESSDIDGDQLTYRLELRDGDTSQIEVFDNLSDSSLEVSGLRYNNAYFWQVSVNDGINTNVLSEIHSFETKDAPDDLIMFVRNISGNDVIFSAEDFGDGTGYLENQLTDQTLNSWRPRKNPVNTSVAFLRNTGSEKHIFLMEVDGANITQITNSIPIAGFNDSEIDFSWSANGNQLIYPSFDKLYLINKDGTGNALIYQSPTGNFITECNWSLDGSKIALKTNDVNGYDIEIYTINMSGVVQDTILSGVLGAAGGLQFSVDGTKLLYTHDVSSFESAAYRQLDTHVFIYDFVTSTSTDISSFKPSGFLDSDPRFSQNESHVLVSYSSNTLNAPKELVQIEILDLDERETIVNDAKMSDW